MFNMITHVLFLSEKIIQQSMHFSELSQHPWRQLFDNAIRIFAALIPPTGLIDPGLTQMVQLETYNLKATAFELFASCNAVFPATASAHPFLRFIHESILQTLMDVDQIEERKKQVYRVNHLRVLFKNHF